MAVVTNFSDTNILYAANLNSAYANCVNVHGDFISGQLNATTLTATNITANTALVIGTIDVGSGLASAYNAANGAFAKANVGGTSGTGSFTFIANTSQPGLTVNNSVNIIIPANTAVVFGANAATTSQVGVVKLNDTTSSSLANQAATANAVFVVGNAATAAYAKANTLGTTGVVGVVQLNDTTTSVSTSLAGTANSVSTVMVTAQAAFNRANSGGGSGGVITFIANTFQPGLTVNNGVNITVAGNNTLILGANSSTTGQAGVVQLNDTTTSVSTSLAGTANSVNTAMTYAQGAFARANTLDGIGSLTLIAGNAQTVNTGISITLTANGTVVIAANNATTAAVGVVQLNDTTTSALTSQAATANAVNTVMVTAQAAFVNANNALARTGGTITGALTVNSNVVAANIVTSGSVNSASLMVNPITSSANYILSQRDNGNVVTFSNSGTTLVNVNSNLTVGYRTVLTQIGSGNVQVQAGGGVTLNPTSGISNQIAARWSSISLFCYATNSFILDGSLI